MKLIEKINETSQNKVRAAMPKEEFEVDTEEVGTIEPLELSSSPMTKKRLTLEKKD